MIFRTTTGESGILKERNELLKLFIMTKKVPYMYHCCNKITMDDFLFLDHGQSQ